MAHTRAFGGYKYKLHNVYYGVAQKPRLKKDVMWAKQHGIRYRTTRISTKEPDGKTIKGMALWFRD